MLFLVMFFIGITKHLRKEVGKYFVFCLCVRTCFILNQGYGNESDLRVSLSISKIELSADIYGYLLMLSADVQF